MRGCRCFTLCSDVPKRAASRLGRARGLDFRGLGLRGLASEPKIRTPSPGHPQWHPPVKTPTSDQCEERQTLTPRIRHPIWQSSTRKVTLIGLVQSVSVDDVFRAYDVVSLVLDICHGPTFQGTAQKVAMVKSSRNSQSPGDQLRLPSFDAAFCPTSLRTHLNCSSVITALPACRPPLDPSVAVTIRRWSVQTSVGQISKLHHSSSSSSATLGLGSSLRLQGD